MPPFAIAPSCKARLTQGSNQGRRGAIKAGSWARAAARREPLTDAQRYEDNSQIEAGVDRHQAHGVLPHHGCRLLLVSAAEWLLRLRCAARGRERRRRWMVRGARRALCCIAQASFVTSMPPHRLVVVLEHAFVGLGSTNCASKHSDRGLGLCWLSGVVQKRDVSQHIAPAPLPALNTTQYCPPCTSACPPPQPASFHHPAPADNHRLHLFASVGIAPRSAQPPRSSLCGPASQGLPAALWTSLR